MNFTPGDPKSASITPPSLAYPDMRGKVRRPAPTSSSSSTMATTEADGEEMDSSSMLSLRRSEEERQRQEFLEKRNSLLELLQSTGQLLERVLDRRDLMEYCSTLFRKSHRSYSRSGSMSNIRGSQNSTPASSSSSSPRKTSSSSPLAIGRAGHMEGTASPTLGSSYSLLLQTPNFHVFRIDIKSTGSRSSADAIRHIHLHSDPDLFLQTMADGRAHVRRLETRIQDTQSKVLVTGDVNAGKSTLINALLKREILPHDQQPCTAAFCDVLDACHNAGVEEVHAIIDPSLYDPSDPKTFTRFPLSQLVSAHQANDQYQVWKVYVNDSDQERESLLHNGIVDLTFIDSPGLNRDLTQTMAVFAQHEEIDAVIFVVNAENHFTLSVSFHHITWISLYPSSTSRVPTLLWRRVRRSHS